MIFQRAKRLQSKLRLGITGTSGSGKTYSALLLAAGLGGRIAMIDTENGSGSLYANICDYDVCTLNAPYTVERYLTALKEAEKAGYDVIIIDSLSHEWSGEGGILEQHDLITEKMRGNSFSSWRPVLQNHNKLLSAILASPAHIIATMRSKTTYAQIENDRGRTEIKKIGLAPVQRDGMEYEFGVVFDLNSEHVATVSKDRTGLFDGQAFNINSQTGELLRDWLNSCEIPTTSDNPILKQRAKTIYGKFLNLYDNDQERAKAVINAIIPDKPSSQWTEQDLIKLDSEFESRQSESEAMQEPKEESPE